MYRKLTLSVIAIFCTLGLVACGSNSQGSPVAPNRYGNTKIHTGAGAPQVLLTQVDPPFGSTLHAGQTVKVEIAFTVNPDVYPVEASFALMGSVYPGGWGCNAQVFEEAVGHTYACSLYIDQFFVDWWRKYGNTYLDGEFIVYANGSGGPLEEAPIWKKFESMYRLP